MPAEYPRELSRDERDGDEVEEVLAALDELAQKVSSPVIRACLESARDDIAHLAATGGAGGTVTPV